MKIRHITSTASISYTDSASFLYDINIEGEMFPTSDYPRKWSACVPYDAKLKLAYRVRIGTS